MVSYVFWTFLKLWSGFLQIKKNPTLNITILLTASIVFTFRAYRGTPSGNRNN